MPAQISCLKLHSISQTISTTEYFTGRHQEEDPLYEEGPHQEADPRQEEGLPRVHTGHQPTVGNLSRVPAPPVAKPDLRLHDLPPGRHSKDATSNVDRPAPARRRLKEGSVHKTYIVMTLHYASESLIWSLYKASHSSKHFDILSRCANH